MALSAGLYASHVFIPPTPGPIAAAGAVGLSHNLLLVIGMGFVVSIPVLIASYFFAKYVGKQVSVMEEAQADQVISQSYEDLIKQYGKLPSGF